MIYLKHYYLTLITSGNIFRNPWKKILVSPVLLYTTSQVLNNNMRDLVTTIFQETTDVFDLIYFDHHTNVNLIHFRSISSNTLRRLSYQSPFPLCGNKFPMLPDKCPQQLQGFCSSRIELGFSLSGS